MVRPAGVGAAAASTKPPAHGSRTRLHNMIRHRLWRRASRRECTDFARRPAARLYSGWHGAGAPIRGDIVTTQAKGPSAGFGWLQRAIGLGYHHPQPIFGGAVILLVIAMLPSLILLPFQFHWKAAGTPPSPALFVSIMAISMLVGLLVVPLYAGYLQVIDAAERGLPARATGIFDPYRQGDALRLIGFGVALAVIYLLLMGIIVLAAGRGIVDWYMQVLASQTSHATPPGLPPGFGIAMALLSVMGLYMMGFYSVGLGQVALARRSVLDALGDGFLGALKNLLPLLVLAACLVVAWIAVMIALIIVVLVFTLVGMLVGKWLVFAVIIPVYIAMVLVVFAVMFGVMYYLWRDVCGDDAASGAAQTIAA